MALTELDQLCHQQIRIAINDYQDQLGMQNCKHCIWNIIVLEMEDIFIHLFFSLDCLDKVMYGQIGQVLEESCHE